MNWPALFKAVGLSALIIIGGLFSIGLLVYGLMLAVWWLDERGIPAPISVFGPLLLAVVACQAKAFYDRFNR